MLGKFPSLSISSLRSVSFRRLANLMVSSLLCSEMAVKQIDEPFIQSNDNLEEWAL